MPRASCRCGTTLTIAEGESDRVVCPNCGAKVRIRLRAGSVPVERADGFIRFLCPCGRRLKVDAFSPPTHGKCPECGRVVPIPKGSIPAAGDPETPTADLEPADLALLTEWSERHLAGSRTGTDKTVSQSQVPEGSTAGRPVAPVVRSEAGLRLCPSCGKPIHLGADVCRACGTVVPRR